MCGFEHVSANHFGNVMQNSQTLLEFNLKAKRNQGLIHKNYPRSRGRKGQSLSKIRSKLLIVFIGIDKYSHCW